MLGVLRFVSIALDDGPKFVLTIYYFVFAALLVIAEFQLRMIMQYFHFLYYSWGKSVLDFFLFTITFETANLAVFQLPVSIFFFCTGCMYLIIAFACKKNPEAEKAKEEHKKENKEKKKEAPKKDNANRA